MTGSVHLSASIIAVVPQRLQLNLKKKKPNNNDKFSGKSATRTVAAAEIYL